MTTALAKADATPATEPHALDKSAGEAGCWLWTKAVNSAGYGVFRRHGKNHYAHRAAYEAVHGTLPRGLFVCHRCDTPRCCNPSHLFAGTQSDNMADCSAKGRTARGERSHWSKMTPDSIRAIRRRRAEGRSYSQLRAEFGLTNATLFDIINRKSWRHVP
jgi:hypothetical protein